ncbi:MAG: DUF489 family protein [Ostreibacterium sp.]
MNKPINLINDIITTMTNDKQQVIALSATIQALSNVQEIATNGQFDADRALPIFRALTNYDPTDTLDAYGGDISTLHHGLQLLAHFLSDKLNRDLAQYILNVITIEKKLVINPTMRAILQRELSHIVDDNQNSHDAVDSHNFDDEDFGAGFNHHDNALDDENEDKIKQNHDTFLLSDIVISRFADIYKQTASNTEPRIMVKGNHQFLQNEMSANQIRALLLGALRGIAFFRHYDGKRIDFILKRKHYMNITQQLL